MDRLFSITENTVVGIIIFSLGLFLFVIIPFKNVVRFRKFSSYSSLPWLGNLLELKRFQHDLNGTLDLLYLNLGLRSVVWATHWFPIVVIGNAKDAKLVLKSKVNSEKGLLYKVFNECIGTGTFNSPVDIWKIRRPHLEKAFHSKVLRHLPVVFDKCSRTLINALERDGRISTGKTFDVHPYLNKCSIQMLIGGAFGLESNPFQKNKDPYGIQWDEAIKRYNQGTYIAEYRMLRPWYLLIDCLWKLTDKAKEMIDISEWLHYRVFRKLLHNHEKIIMNLDEEDPQSEYSNFLQTLRRLRIQRPELHLFEEKEMLYEMTSLYIAGHDATSKAISFGLLFLGMHKRCQNLVQDELKENFGVEDTGEHPVDEEALRKMKYLECCVKETLRLIPPVPVITRKTGEDVELHDGVIIPKGTEVAIIPYLIHRDPEIFHDDVEIFKPERFLLSSKESSEAIGSWIPFSFGPRNCLGMKYAMMEVKVVLANLLRRYNVETEIAKKEDWVLSSNITIKLEGGWNIRLVKRDQ